jgi:hypothetical protein
MMQEFKFVNVIGKVNLKHDELVGGLTQPIFPYQTNKQIVYINYCSWFLLETKRYDSKLNHMTNRSSSPNYTIE